MDSAPLYSDMRPGDSKWSITIWARVMPVRHGDVRLPDRAARRLQLLFSQAAPPYFDQYLTRGAGGHGDKSNNISPLAIMMGAMLVQI
ncbi:MAG TPA: hypothetical protein VK638_15775 [Edaphobacter sp.]|nr:hypothetical protein [Edaphobacter sp.]